VASQFSGAEDDVESDCGLKPRKTHTRSHALDIRDSPSGSDDLVKFSRTFTPELVLIALNNPLDLGQLGTVFDDDLGKPAVWEFEKLSLILVKKLQKASLL
jgi:hypothetical protein